VAEKLKKRFDLQSIRMAGSAGRKIRRVAVCSGAGGSLLDLFLKSDADLYISGDFRYHDARTVEEAGKAMIDVGHFASEQIVIDTLVDRLRRAAKASNWSVAIEACRLERDPFTLM
jgi:putative NIF3 family GTP cyclohydrolase 1 type 2